MISAQLMHLWCVCMRVCVYTLVLFQLIITVVTKFYFSKVLKILVNHNYN